MVTASQSRLNPSREKMEAFSGKLSSKLHSVWYWLILKNVKVTGMIILVVGLVGVLGTGVFLTWFFRNAPVGSEMKPIERGLNTAVIDRLELWIEQVDAQRREGMSLPSRPLFVADDLHLVTEEPQP